MASADDDSRSTVRRRPVATSASAAAAADVDDLDERLAGTPLKNEDPLRFKLQRRLADTLQGRVWLALDQKTDQMCIVKQASRFLIIRGVSRQNVKVPEDFPAEIRTHMHLCADDKVDPGLVRALAWWTDADNIYMAAEFCAGGELFEYIKESGVSGALSRDIGRVARLEQRTQSSRSMSRWLAHVQALFRNIVKATYYVHRKNVAHLDMSLENTMIAAPRSVQTKIIDFGVAQRFPEGDFTRCGRVGKVGYMAPEVLAGKKFDARAADIWCLGVMLFMMVVGAPPFPKAEPMRRGGRPTVFDYVIRGKLAHVLQQWKRLPLVTDECLDLMNRIFRKESHRITMDEMMRHPFIGLGDMLDKDDGEGDASDGIELSKDVEMRDASKLAAGSSSSSSSASASPGGGESGSSADGGGPKLATASDSDSRAEGEEVRGEAGAAPPSAPVRPVRLDSRSVRKEPGAKTPGETDADGDTAMTSKRYETEVARVFYEKLQKVGTDDPALRGLLEAVTEQLKGQNSTPTSPGIKPGEKLSPAAIEELRRLQGEISRSVQP